MDAHLKLLAEIGLAIGEAEEALGTGEAGQAEEALDRAADGLVELRGRWAAMGAGERAIVGPAASPLRTRLDAARGRLPRRSALSEGAPERDPDEERDPEEATAP
jgi:hypothetical protein